MRWFDYTKATRGVKNTENGAGNSANTVGKNSGNAAVANIADAGNKTKEHKLQAAQQRIDDLSKTPRPSQPFTKAGKDAVKNYNSIKNDGVIKCEHCSIETVPAQKHQRGVTPPSSEAHVDHIVPQAQGGSGTPDNGQILCRSCNLKKGNK